MDCPINLPYEVIRNIATSAGNSPADQIARIALMAPGMESGVGW